MPDPTCDTRMLDVLRSRALLEAKRTSDPLTRQQYVDLARTYAVTAGELRAGHGPGAASIEFRATRMPWRSVPLWVTNDR